MGRKITNTNWNLRSVSAEQVDLSVGGACQNVGNYTVPDNKMLLVTARYMRQEISPPTSSAVGAQSFATMAFSNGELVSANAELHNFNTRLVVRAQGDNHRLRILKSSGSFPPGSLKEEDFQAGTLAIHNLKNTVTV